MTAARADTSALPMIAVLALAVGAIAYAQPRLVARSAPSKSAKAAATDVFALPPPALLDAMSLGYRSALADILFTETIVSNGIHAEERRRFEHVGAYLESISELDPRFCQTYRYADSLIVYQPVGSPTPEDMRVTRRLLERGLEMCPFDGPLHMSAGQFMLFIATQFLTSEDEKEAFRAAGAKVLARAGELETGNVNVQWQAVTAAGVFARAGQRDAAISFLERVYTVTDDEELRRNIAGKLAVLRKEEAGARAEAQEASFRRLWRADLPFSSRTEALVLGPRFDPSRCAGARDGRCPTSWFDWAAAQGDADAPPAPTSE